MVIWRACYMARRPVHDGGLIASVSTGHEGARTAKTVGKQKERENPIAFSVHHMTLPCAETDASSLRRPRPRKGGSSRTCYTCYAVGTSSCARSMTSESRACQPQPRSPPCLNPRSPNRMADTHPLLPRSFEPHVSRGQKGARGSHLRRDTKRRSCRLATVVTAL